MEIKVNDYVRTDKGNISKIKWISQQIINSNETKSGTFHLENGEIVHMHYGDIIKSSPRIIDLIEENDVIKFWYEKEKICYVYKVNDKLCVWDGFQDRPIEGIHIISVLTKEMFEQMEYKIND